VQVAERIMAFGLWLVVDLKNVGDVDDRNFAEAACQPREFEDVGVGFGPNCEIV
jgi:hypothetical protein